MCLYSVLRTYNSGEKVCAKLRRVKLNTVLTVKFLPCDQSHQKIENGMSIFNSCENPLDSLSRLSRSALMTCLCGQYWIPNVP
jgi:hypothetical protein